MDIEKLKSQVKDRVGKTIMFKTCSFSSNNAIEKTETKSESASGEYKDYDFVAIVSNALFIDSHNDMHLPKMWREESFKDVSYIIDHNFAVSSLIASPKDLSIKVDSKSWRDLGYDVDGETEVLMFYVKLQDYSNKSFVDAFKSGVPLQNSVRMKYNDIVLCVSDENEKEEFANWNKYFPMVANKDKALEDGYFFAVKSADLVLESSCVLRGSNSMTPIMEVQQTYSTGDEPKSQIEKGEKNLPVWFNLM